jgi:hypothetical protein
MSVGGQVTRRKRPRKKATPRFPRRQRSRSIETTWRRATWWLLQRILPPHNATNLRFRDRLKKEKARATSTQVTQASKPAERAGFEPAVRFYPYAALAKRCFRPLSHLSGAIFQDSLPLEPPPPNRELFSDATLLWVIAEHSTSSRFGRSLAGSGARRSEGGSATLARTRMKRLKNMFALEMIWKLAVSHGPNWTASPSPA